MEFWEESKGGNKESLFRRPEWDLEPLRQEPGFFCATGDPIQSGVKGLWPSRHPLMRLSRQWQYGGQAGSAEGESQSVRLRSADESCRVGRVQLIRPTLDLEPDVIDVRPDGQCFNNPSRDSEISSSFIRRLHDTCRSHQGQALLMPLGKFYVHTEDPIPTLMEQI